MDIKLADLIELWGNPNSSRENDLRNSLGTVCTDTRKIKRGDFFVPLRGETFDGHSFLVEAFYMGAQAAVVSTECSLEMPNDWLYWVVKDTLQAYQQLASLYRRKLDIPVIGITGSVGKTTTRELIKASLTPLGEILSTQNNNNNDIGVPLTLLQGDSSHRVAIIEMGMRGIGEIERLSNCSKPDIAVITNIGSAHIGRLGSFSKIAQAKCEIISGLNSSGVVIIPAGDSLLDRTLRAGWKGRIIRVALLNDLVEKKLEHLADTSYVDLLGEVDVSNNTLSVNGEIYNLPLNGMHNAINFLLAISVSRELGVPAELINDLKIDISSGRNRKIIRGGITILDETYNSSPESVKAALTMLNSMPGRNFAVLGKMLELGDKSVYFHRKVAQQASDLRLDGLIIVAQGDEADVMALTASSLPRLEIVSTPELSHDLLLSWLQPGDVVLLKASRGVAMEKLVYLLEESLGS